MKRLAPPALLLLFAACDAGFEPQYRVTDLRILGVRAEVVDGARERWVDATPGDTVRIEALVANPRGHGDVAVRWYACVPDGTDAVPPCIDADALRDPDALAGREGVVQLPAGVPAGSGIWQATVAIPDAGVGPVRDALAAALELARSRPSFQCSLYVEVPVVVVAEGGGRREVAVKRVRLTPDPATLEASLSGKYVRNENPSPVSVLRRPVDDGPCGGEPILPGAQLPSEAFLCGGSDAAGPYTVCDADGNATPTREEPSWQWYTTGGEFPEEDGIGNATGGTITFEPPAGPFTLWAIVRDGRGGESWAIVGDLRGRP